ncbi:MAG TPA: hypothetical protein VL882_01635 [Vicinamibacterales bacterium]|jgi:hypothetical protein|nr:hypothetical protein [Vicinamibacterales bacterium]
MQTHVKVLGVVYLAVGGCMLLAALFLFLTLGGVAGIVGATAEPQDAAIAIPVLGFAGTALAAFFTLFSLPSLITGYGLLNYKPWARVVGIVLSAISLINIPIGTVVGAYGLWVLLNQETERLFNNLPVAAPPA